MSRRVFRLAVVVLAGAALAVAAIAFAVPVLDERSAYEQAKQEQRECEAGLARNTEALGEFAGEFCGDELWPELRESR